MAAGASAGFAVAFRAPVGGMLFGLEELVSFWSLKLGVMIFFCCLFGVVTTSVFISSVIEFSFVDSFGLMRTDKYVKFKVLQLASSLNHQFHCSNCCYLLILRDRVKSHRIFL